MEHAPPPETAAGRLRQREMPFAIVHGETLSEPPEDLYIPPAALRIFLEAFEGPLDLLLYLIRRQNLNILDIDLVELTNQYLKYIKLLDRMQIELAAEYLVMAATLAEVKSRVLLPRSAEEEGEEDPRAALIERLQEYERFKKAAQQIDALPRIDRDFYRAEAEPPPHLQPQILPQPDLDELLHALSTVMRRYEALQTHRILTEPLSTRERMSSILAQLSPTEFTEFSSLYSRAEGCAGVVVSMLALMELVRERLADVVQTESFGLIHVRAAARDNEN